MEGTTSHMLIWERHHGTLGPTATLTGIVLHHWKEPTTGNALLSLGESPLFPPTVPRVG